MKTLSRISLALTLTCPVLDAAVDRAHKPEPAPPPAAAFPDYKKQLLANGLNVFVIEDERTPTVVFRLVIKGGAIFDAQKTGLSGLVATLLNRGTARRDAATFARESDFIGMHLEASTGPDSIAVSAGGLTKYTEKIIDMFSDAVLHPAFGEEQFKMEQRKALSKLAAERMEPDALAAKLSGKLVFGGHPYGAYRTPETVQSIAREDLVEYHKAHFLPNNATLAIVGDVKAATIVPLIEKALTDWKRGDVLQPELPHVAGMKTVEVHFVNRPGSVQSNIVICMPGPPRANGNVPELNVLNATLGGGFSGRLFQNLREKHGYTYGAYSVFILNKTAGAFQATAETRNEVTAPSIREILFEIRRIREEAVPDAELELQRQYNVGNYLLSLENAHRTAQRVQDIDLYGLPPDFYKTYAKRMAETTPEQIKELATKYLDVEKVAIVVVGEGKEIKPELQKIGKVFVYDTDLKPVTAAVP